MCRQQAEIWPGLSSLLVVFFSRHHYTHPARAMPPLFFGKLLIFFALFAEICETISDSDGPVQPLCAARGTQ